MIENDPFLRLQGQLAAQEYVLKITLQVINQLFPHTDIKSAMIQMVKDSVKSASIQVDDPKIVEDLRNYVKIHALQIVDAGFNAHDSK